MSQFENKFSKEFVEQLLEVTVRIIQLPILKPEEEQKIITILNTFFDSSLEVYQQDDNNEIILRLCNCIKQMLCMHKYYKILETLTVFLKSSTEQVKKLFSSNLSDTLTQLSESEKDKKSYVAKELQKTLAVFNTKKQEEKSEEKKIFVVPTGRSARIASLAKKSKSPEKLKKGKPIVSSSPLRLFGTDVETLSPLKVKGSQLNNSPKTTQKKAVNILSNVALKNSKSLNEENSSDFVPINSEVKFDPKKLNEHQKEVMKQRRDNIPALYEDLSQSSQSLFSSKSNSSSMDVLENKEKDTRRQFVQAVENLDTEHANFPTTFTKNEAKTEIENTVFPEKVTDEEKKEETTLKHFSSESDMFKTQSGKSEDIFETPVVVSSSDMTPSKQVPHILDSPSSKSSARRRKTNQEIELRRLQMNIVGADLFTSTSRRTRPKETKKAEDDKKQEEGKKQEDNKKQEDEQKQGEKTPKIKSVQDTDKKQKAPSSEKKSPKKGKSTPIKPESEKLETKRGHKRKLVMEDENEKNDDIIESSQESFTDITSLLNSSKKKSKLDSSEESSTEQKMITVVQKIEGLQEKVTKQSEVGKGKKPRMSNLDIVIDQVASGISTSANSIPANSTPDLTISKGRKPKSPKTESKLNEESVQQSQQNVDSQDKTTPTSTKKVKRQLKLNVENFRVQKEKVDSHQKDVAQDDLPKNSSKTSGELFLELDASENKKISNTIQEALENVENVRVEQERVDSHLEDATQDDIPIKNSDELFLELDASENKKISNIIEEAMESANIDQDITHIQNTIPIQYTTPIRNTIQSPDVNQDTPHSRDTTQSQEITPSKETTHSRDTTLTQDTTQSRETTQIEDSIADIIDNIVVTQETQSIVNKKESQETTFTQETAEFCSESQYVKEPVLYFNLPQRPQLTESEEFQCQMDTMSLGSIQIILSQQQKDVEIRAATPPLEVQSEVMKEVGTPVKEIQSELVNEVKTPLQETQCEPVDEVKTPVKNIEVEYEKMYCVETPVKDTDVAIEMLKEILGTPTTSNIPSSPVTSETPKRTSELLNNTMDISPIHSKSSSSSTESEGSTDIPIQKDINLPDELMELDNDNVYNVVKDLLKDADDAQKFEIVEEDIIESVFQDAEQTTDAGKYGSTSSSSSSEEDSFHEDDSVLVEIEGDQNADIIKEIVTMTNAYDVDKVLIDDVNNVTENVPPDNVQNTSDNAIKTSSIQERSTKLLTMLNVNSPRPFNKRRSSNTGMSPSTGRIRRLMLNIKQKSNSDSEEINEEDILTFKREIPSPLARPRNSILKRKTPDSGDEGLSPYPKRKRVNFSDPCLTSKKIFIKDDGASSYEAKRLFDNYSETKDDSWKDIFDLPDDQRSSESENAETEPSLDIVQPFMLRKDRAIYPKLVDCQDDVIVIVKKITSPLFLDILVNKLKAKKVKTIGDLAQLCEVEINRLPFKVPIVSNVYKALDNYYKKMGGKDEPEHVKTNGLYEDDKEDLDKQIDNVVNKAKKQNTSVEDVARKILSYVNTPLSIFKTFNFSIEELLKEHKTQDILKYILKKTNLQNVLKEVKDISEPQDFSEVIVKHSVNESLVDILRNRTMEEMRAVLTQGKLFEQKTVLNECLLPLVQSPEDLKPYISTLSTNELSDLVVEKVKIDHSDTFLSKLAQALPSSGNNLAVRAMTATLKNENNILDSLKSFLEMQNEEVRKNVMVQMFKYIGNRLDASTCLNLHIELLNKISNTLEDKGSPSCSSK